MKAEEARKLTKEALERNGISLGEVIVLINNQCKQGAETLCRNDIYINQEVEEQLIELGYNVISSRSPLMINWRE